MRVRIARAARYSMCNMIAMFRNYVYSCRRVFVPVLMTLLGLVLAFFVALNIVVPLGFRSDSAATAASGGDRPADLPEPTAADLTSAQEGFDQLIIYTTSGFRPAATTAQRGERVRFTNTAREPIQISLDGTISPLLESGMYWEQVIAGPGVLMYTAGASTGSLIVE